MNTGQTILSLGAVILWSVTVLLTNRASLQHGTIINQTQIDIYAVSLAQAKIEEASGKSFDKYSATDTMGNGNPITSLSQLADPSLLGKEAGEVYPDFNDFDDYNYFTGSNPFKVYVPGVDTFRIQTTVCYVDTSDPGGKASVRTWHKKMVVKVWSTISPWSADTPQPDTVVMTYIYSYWWFR
ncbi:MAG: hypothetical protein NTZ35_10635 [Ignavibacteriales bacterium]|nr:hypothetical protein [Ignavibacteriales bacterium]